MPSTAQFAVKDTANPRVDAEFSVECTSGQPRPLETEYLDTLKMAFDEIARMVEASRRQDGSDGSKVSAITLDRIEQGKNTIGGLKKVAGRFCGSVADQDQSGRDEKARLARNETLELLGRFKAIWEQIEQTPFSVMFVRGNKAKQSLITDLIIVVVNRGGSSGTPKLPLEQEELYSSITETQIVIKEVCRNMRRGTCTEHVENERADLSQHEYLNRLGGIARVGLQLGLTKIASLALSALRDEMTIQQAWRIKNDHLRRLGICSSVVASAALFLACALASEEWWMQFLAAPKAPFLLAAGGAAIGAWLSFSMRKVALKFRELAVLEEDFVHPFARVVIVAMFAVIIVLVLRLDMVAFKIGNFDTKMFSNWGDGSSMAALLIGIFCGVAERAIASVISSRAATVATKLGG